MAKAKTVTGLDPQKHTAVNAAVIARTRLEELYRWNEYVDQPYNVRGLHDMRIAAKRLRYTLEIFADVLPEACKQVTKEVEQIQEELGALHDSDVLIAMLRLCLGAQDGGTGYEYVLAHAERLYAKGRFVLNAEMISHLLGPKVAPNASEREGLELLLQTLQQQRGEQYKAFRQHWYRLQERDFREEVFSILESI